MPDSVAAVPYIMLFLFQGMNCLDIVLTARKMPDWQPAISLKDLRGWSALRKVDCLRDDELSQMKQSGRWTTRIEECQKD
jgi:hypothetical protein